MLLVLAITAQVGLALASKNSPLLGMVQAVGVAVAGLYAVGTRNVSIVTMLCGYLVGAEVLWRQVRVPLPHLAAPYLMTALSVFVILAVLGRLGRDARIAIVYVVLLTPAIVTTVRSAGADSRELVAFALSGPFALAAFVAYTSQMRTDMATYRRILWATLISATGPLAIAISDVGSALVIEGGIDFTGQSNFITSGGFGPVQVSTVLGIGAMIGVILTIVDPSRSARILAGFLAAVFAVQSLLTFSRGGMIATAIALSALVIYRVRERRIRNQVALAIAVALTLGYFVVVPWLEDFTDGAFGERFSDLTTSRTELASNDTEIFRENPVFGVGPGMAKFQRLGYEVCELRSDGCVEEASSHTEWTRMLGEHGIPGILAMVALGLLAVRAVRTHVAERPFAIAFMTWGIAQMFYANLRVVAVPFAFGIAFLSIRQTDQGGGPEADAAGRAPVPVRPMRVPTGEVLGWSGGADEGAAAVTAAAEGTRRPATATPAPPEVVTPSEVLGPGAGPPAPATPPDWATGGPVWTEDPLAWIDGGNGSSPPTNGSSPTGDGPPR